ncbi:MAG: c-type cytochrome [Kofleriaceae bacterium]
MGPLPTGTETAAHDHSSHGGHGGHAGHGGGGMAGGAHAGHAGGMIGVHSKAEASTIDGGARLTFVVSAADVGKIQSELRMHAEHMASGSCKMDAPAVATPPVEAPPVGTHVEHVEPALPDPAQVKADLLAAEAAAFEKAKPVFDASCSSCHAKGGRGAKAKTLGHFDMTTYPFGGHHADKITETIRKSLAIGGGKATMPRNKPGSLTADQLAAVAAWADAYDAASAGGAHEGQPGHDEHHGHGGHKH